MTKIHDLWVIIAITLFLSACGGPTLTKLPPSYEEEATTSSSNSKAIGSGETNNTLPESNASVIEPPAEVVVPKVEPINPGNAKPYTVMGETYAPMKEISTFMQKGFASWYGKMFHGRKTANGEIFNMYKLSAAHKTLPIPSYVQVTNEHNQKSIIVRVNDRGPFIKGRIIDLSYAAAKKLDMLGHGTIPVTIQLVDPKNPETFKPIDDTQQPAETLEMQAQKNASEELSPVSTNKQIPAISSEPVNNTNAAIQTSVITGVKGSFVQVGAFKSEQNADGLYQRIAQTQVAQNAKLNKVYNGSVYQIVLGPYAEYELAKQVSVQIRDQLQLSSMVFSQ